MILPRNPQPAAAVADHYDELDAIYRTLWGEHVHHGLWRTGAETQAEAVVALSDLVGQELAFRPGDRLVDIGCGYGGTARRFADRGAHVTGFTLSAQQASQAMPHAGVALRVRDWLDNGLADGSADGAYAIESSEHIGDRPAFFGEARRVLRPGRRLVVCAWLAAEAPAAWQVRHLLEPICTEGRLASLGTETEYRDLAARAGFRTVRFEDVSALVSRTWMLCLRRFAVAMVTDGGLRGSILRARNRSFALSVPRLILAYRTGAMRYGVFTFESWHAAA